MVVIGCAAHKQLLTDCIKALMKANEGRPLAPPDGASLIYVSSDLSRRSKKLTEKTRKKQYS